MAQTIPATRTFKDTIGLTGGVNSYVDPQFISETEVRWAENAVNKGGIWQTRPGFDQVVSLLYTEEGGGDFYTWWDSAGRPNVYPQFFTVFQPNKSSPQFIFGLSGAVFYCTINNDGSTSSPRQITQLSFDANATQICACATVKTADIQNGSFFVTPAQNILMIQDGVGRAGYWDGDSGGHLNPAKKWTADSLGNTLYVDGYNQTPIGTWMAWSGNRLWVANGSQVFASDLGDPIHFTEETVLTNIPAFTFPDNVTGLIDRGTSGVQENLLFVGTTKGIYTIHSGIQARGYWASTGDFVRKVFSGVSCVSHKSMVTHMGLLYWYSDTGIVAFDSLGTVVSTQSLPPIDSEMAYSKMHMSPDRSGVCAGFFDSYVFWSVPVPVKPEFTNYKATYKGRIFNGHTQVLDRIVMPVEFNIGAGASFASSAWQGVWTGLRPIEWATAYVHNRMRTFCMSVDYDGIIRIWEGFNGNRSDNNKPVTWAVETKSHPVTSSPFDRSVFRNFRVLMTEILGKLEIQGYWKGLRGNYHQLLNTSVYATPGSVLLPNPDYFPITNTTDNKSFAKQFRDIRSMDNRAKELCTSAGVESPDQDDIDRAFSLLFRLKGIGAIKAYRIAVDYNPDNTEGEVLAPESGQRMLPEVGCPEIYSAGNQQYTMVYRDSKDALLPVSSRYNETGYTPDYSTG